MTGRPGGYGDGGRGSGMPVVPSNNPYYCREAGRHDCPMHVQLSISSSAAHSETHWLDHRLDPLSVVVVEVLFYVHRNRRFIRDAGAQDVQLDVRTAPARSSPPLSFSVARSAYRWCQCLTARPWWLRCCLLSLGWTDTRHSGFSQ